MSMLSILMQTVQMLLMQRPLRFFDCVLSWRSMRRELATNLMS